MKKGQKIIINASGELLPLQRKAMQEKENEAITEAEVIEAVQAGYRLIATVRVVNEDKTITIEEWILVGSRVVSMVKLSFFQKVGRWIVRLFKKKK